MIDLTRGIPGIPIDHELLDTNPWLLGVRNGVIDLQAGQFRKADPDDLMMMQSPVEWDDLAVAPRWETALEEWFPDPSIRSYVHRLVGQALVGLQQDHIFAIHYGIGGNGKGTFVRALQHVLDPYAATPDLKLLVHQKWGAHDTATSTLFRTRLAVASETDHRVKLNEASIKNLTGGDRIGGSIRERVCSRVWGKPIPDNQKSPRPTTPRGGFLMDCESSPKSTRTKRTPHPSESLRDRRVGGSLISQLLVQLTVLPGTGPSEVGGLKVQVTVSTVVPSGCSTVMMALVNARSSMVSVQRLFGQSGAPAMTADGATVTTLNGVKPFLNSSSGIAWLPVTVIGAGFCPGGRFSPVPGLMHEEVTSAAATRVTNTSPLPSPAICPEALRVRPPSKNDGSAFFPPLRWTLAANAGAASAPTTNTITIRSAVRLIAWSPFNSLRASPRVWFRG